MFGMLEAAGVAVPEQVDAIHQAVAGSSNRRDGLLSPRRIAPPSRTLSRSSSNILAFIAELLAETCAETGTETPVTLRL